MADNYKQAVKDITNLITDNLIDNPVNNGGVWVSLQDLEAMFTQIVFTTREHLLEQSNDFLGVNKFSGSITGTTYFINTVVAGALREGGVALSTKYVLRSEYDLKITEIGDRLDALENP